MRCGVLVTCSTTQEIRSVSSPGARWDWRCGRRARFARPPRMALLGVAVALVFVANLAISGLSPLVRGLLGNVAIVVAFAAIADRDEPIAPYAGLVLLALPLLQSLQANGNVLSGDAFAAAVRWLLIASGSEVSGDGAQWTIDGHAVAAAFRGGPQLAWVGCFVACATAWMFGLRNRAFLARLPVVALVVTIVQVLRTTVLMSADAGGVAMTDAMDAALGLLACTAVGATIAVVFATRRGTKTPPVADTAILVPANEERPPNGARWRIVYAGLLLVSASLPLAVRA
ncbi:MAG: hypothetical protein ABI277_02630 [Burkholderiaceae bacterium]